MTYARQFIGLLVALVFCFGSAIIAIPFMTQHAMLWYHRLQAPAWAPPDWLFGPVWTLLYLLMGVAAWLIWRKGDASVTRVPLTIWAVQLVLNAVWSPIFFGAHMITLALVVALALWCCIVLCIVTFRRVSEASAWLMGPYLAWTTFAVALTAAFWRLNR